MFLTAAVRLASSLDLYTGNICSEEDEFAVPSLSKEAQKEIAEQLKKDGYDLDLEPDDEDLDLIPPRPLHERCGCCPSATWIPKKCAVQ